MLFSRSRRAAYASVAGALPLLGFGLSISGLHHTFGLAAAGAVAGAVAAETDTLGDGVFRRVLIYYLVVCSAVGVPGLLVMAGVLSIDAAMAALGPLALLGSVVCGFGLVAVSRSAESREPRRQSFRSALSSYLGVVVCYVGVLGVGCVEFRSSPHLSLDVFYLIAVLCGTALTGFWGGASAAVVAGVTHGLVQQLGAVEMSRITGFWNATGLVLGLFAAAYLLGEILDAISAEKEAARVDPLTGLLSRSELVRAGEMEVALARRHEEAMVLALLDLDNFKLVNDGQGHAAGDACLREVAAVLDEHTRRTDVAGRLGGDEFILILPGTSKGDAWNVLRLLEAAITERTARKGWPVGISAGVACHGPDGSTLDELMRVADQRMYRSKSERRHRQRSQAGG